MKKEQKTKKYLVVGGYVISQYDNDEHYVSARTLCRLYNVNPEECILHNQSDHEPRHIEEIYSILGYSRDFLLNLKILKPRYDGNYNISK